MSGWKPTSSQNVILPPFVWQKPASKPLSWQKPQDSQLPLYRKVSHYNLPIYNSNLIKPTHEEPEYPNNESSFGPPGIVYASKE